MKHNMTLSLSFHTIRILVPLLSDIIFFSCFLVFLFISLLSQALFLFYLTLAFLLSFVLTHMPSLHHCCPEFDERDHLYYKIYTG